MNRAPRVSVVIPAWRSEATAGGCLEALRAQSYGDFETIVVDSSPTGATAAVVEAYPEVRLLRSPTRLLPHAARNRGATVARGELLVFTDPDVYPRPGWLAALVARHDASGQAVVSALLCHGERWLDRGIHLAKFSKWLPGASPETVDNAPTAGVLYPRALYDSLGGFSDSVMAGDALFSWRARRRGTSLVVEPRALAAHHHLSRFREFLRERFVRGVDFAAVRADWAGHGRGRDLLFLLVSALPVRLARALLLIAGHSRRSGHLATFLGTLPVVVAGHAASCAGEALAHARRLTRQPRPVQPPAPSQVEAAD